MSSEPNYADLTYNTKNPLARFAHRTRMKFGKKIVLSEVCNSILDFGAGDCKFLEELNNENSSIKMDAYEPVMEVSTLNKIDVYSDLEDLKGKTYDTITCFEVLEHFNPEEQKIHLKDIYDLLAKNGTLVVSVPIEIGFPSVIKNIRRTGFNSKSIKTIVQCFLGIEPPLIRAQKGYIFSHLGFNHHKLEQLIDTNFIKIKKYNSPFKYLPENLNSQVFYKLQKK